VDWKWTGSGLEVDWKWTGSGLEVDNIIQYVGIPEAGKKKQSQLHHFLGKK
jgi:hypothetical protein